MGDLRTEQFVSKIWSIWSAGLAQQSASEPAWKHGPARRLKGEAKARAARREVRREVCESCMVMMIDVWRAWRRLEDWNVRRFVRSGRMRMDLVCSWDQRPSAFVRTRFRDDDGFDTTGINGSSK
jgi:hypothetical protein